MTDVDSLAPTVAVVRSAYLRELKKFYQSKSGAKPVSDDFVAGKVKKLSTKDNTGINFWEKLLSYCQANGFDCNRLIKAFFLKQQSVNNFMLLRHEDIFSKTVAQVYTTLQSSAESCKASFDLQKKTLMTHTEKQYLLNGTDPNKSAELALSTTTAPYCALFRFCMLEFLGFDSSPWKFQAASQYLPDKESYDKAWGKYIPESLKVLGLKRKGAVA